MVVNDKPSAYSIERPANRTPDSTRSAGHQRDLVHQGICHRSRLLTVAFAHEVADRRVGSGQCLFVGQEDDAEVFCAGTLAETGAVNQRHMLLADDFGDEDVVAFRDVDAGIRIESSTGGDATYARSFGAPFHGEIAAAAQFALHFDEVI